jgi:hypothetical protein
MTPEAGTPTGVTVWAAHGVAWIPWYVGEHYNERACSASQYRGLGADRTQAFST